MKKLKVLSIFAIFFISVLSGQNADKFFKKNCFSCHTIGGGRLTGPDLKNVHLRKDDAWLEKFILNPEVILVSGDSYAAKLLKEARGVKMIRVAGLTPSLVRAILKFIREESGKEKSKYAKSPLKDRPLTEEDIIVGRKLFTGELHLKNGGPSCLGCHSISGEGFFGGGNLGPDLTKVFGRLGGKKALMAWLTNPSSVTMSPIFGKYPIAEEEVLPIVAFFKSRAEGDESEMDVHDFNFLIIGLFGVLLLLLLMDIVWRRRLKNVRKSIVEGESE